MSRSFSLGPLEPPRRSRTSAFGRSFSVVKIRLVAGTVEFGVSPVHCLTGRDAPHTRPPAIAASPSACTADKARRRRYRQHFRVHDPFQPFGLARSGPPAQRCCVMASRTRTIGPSRSSCRKGELRMSSMRPHRDVVAIAQSYRPGAVQTRWADSGPAPICRWAASRNQRG